MGKVPEYWPKNMKFREGLESRSKRGPHPTKGTYNNYSDTKTVKMKVKAGSP